MKHIGLLYHPRNPETQKLAHSLRQVLEERGARAWIVSAWDERAILGRVTELDLLVTLGGDGTILRAARVAAPYGVPILGVNFGRLGFLAELQPEEALERVPTVLDGNYRLEERMLLHADLCRDGDRLAGYEALNDVFLGRGAVPKAVHLTTLVDGEVLTTYVADGVVVATPTGSTAYTLSAGGPVIDPRVRSLLLVPIVPHLTTVHALVLPPEAVITFRIRADYAAVLSIDGQIHLEVQDDDQVNVTGSQYNASFLKLGPGNRFYGTLLERLK